MRKPREFPGIQLCSGERTRPRVHPTGARAGWLCVAGPLKRRAVVGEAPTTAREGACAPRATAWFPLRACFRSSSGIAALIMAFVLTSFSTARLHAAPFALENDQVTVTCESKGGRLLPGSLQDKKTGQIVKLGRDLFSAGADQRRRFAFRRNSNLTARRASFHCRSIRTLRVSPSGLPGKELSPTWPARTATLHVTWHLILRDGSRYLREQLVLTAGKSALPLEGRRSCWKRRMSRPARPARWTVVRWRTRRRSLAWSIRFRSIARRWVLCVAFCRAARPSSRARVWTVRWWSASCGPGNCAAIFWPTSNANARIPIGRFCITIPGMTSVISANTTKRRR